MIIKIHQFNVYIWLSIDILKLKINKIFFYIKLIIETNFDSSTNSFKLEICTEVSFKIAFNNLIKVDISFVSIILGNKKIKIIVILFILRLKYK
jgi:hypothetical protein